MVVRLLINVYIFIINDPYIAIWFLGWNSFYGDSLQLLVGFMSPSWSITKLFRIRYAKQKQICGSCISKGPSPPPLLQL